jgi:anti-anti-sigma factor
MSSTPTHQIDSSHGRTIIVLQKGLNEIPWSEIEAVGAQILQALQPVKTPQVLVDLSPLDYMGSASLALVVRVYKAVTERQGRMIVANQHPLVGELIQKAGLDKVWELVGNRDEGLKRLGIPLSESIQQAGGASNVFAATGLLIAIIGLVLSVAVPSVSPLVGVVMQLAGGFEALALSLFSLVRVPHGSRAVSAALLVGGVLCLLSGVVFLKDLPGGGVTP